MQIYYASTVSLSIYHIRITDSATSYMHDDSCRDILSAPRVEMTHFQTLRRQFLLQTIINLGSFTLGTYKWKELGLSYSLENVDPPSLEEVKKAKEILHAF